MKLFIGILAVVSLVSFLAGCAGNDVVYVPKIPRPAKAKLIGYSDLPEKKVFVFAIDPGGEFAYGYASGKTTLRAAANGAVEMCNAGRRSRMVVAKPYIYAVNDKVIFKEMIPAEPEVVRETERVGARDPIMDLNDL